MHKQAVFHGRTGRLRARFRPACAAWLGASGFWASLPAQAAVALTTPVPAGGWLLAAGLALLLVAVVLALALVCWLDRQRADPARQTFEGIDTAPWPALTVFVAVRAQDPALSSSLQTLLNTDYPPERLRIVPVSEPGDAASRAIINAYAHLFPERIVPCLHSAGEAGQHTGHPTMLHEALGLAQGDLAVWLDAADTQRPDLFKQLVKPFFDPEVGAVMGRVAPLPAGGLAHTLARWGLWTKGQAASAAKGDAPSRTWCALRLSAVQAVGGWSNSPPPVHPGQVVHAEVFRSICQRLQTQGWITLTDHRALFGPAAPQGRALASGGGVMPPGRGLFAEAAALRPHPVPPAETTQPPAPVRPRATEPSLRIRTLRPVVEPA